MIVVGGEALVDLVPDSATVGGELGPLHPRLGGGPYNVSIALGRLGAAVRFFARISTDPFGDKLIDRLRVSSVDTSLIQRGSEPTTLAVVGFDDSGSAHYSFHTAETAGRYVVDPGPLPGDTTAVSFGTLSMVLEPGATVYESVLLREAELGRFIALDPNIRANLIEKPEAYRKRFQLWLPAVTLLKLSVEDARWLMGCDDGDLFAALRQWQQAGPEAVVLTKGDDGLAVLTGAGDVVEVPAVVTDVVDTIGAGDTVQAALLAWLDRYGALSASALRQLSGDDWDRALRFAAAAAAVTVSRPGAEPPFQQEIRN